MECEKNSLETGKNFPFIESIKNPGPENQDGKSSVLRISVQMPGKYFEKSGVDNIEGVNLFFAVGGCR